MPAPTKRPENLCMAPWTHTYLSPQTERRICCASREPAQNFRQYINTAAGTGKYTPITLTEHWNLSHMRSVRRRMMAGESLSAEQICQQIRRLDQRRGQNLRKVIWELAESLEYDTG